VCSVGKAGYMLRFSVRSKLHDWHLRLCVRASMSRHWTILTNKSEILGKENRTLTCAKRFDVVR
jgi:hypothetical protein